MRKMCLRLAISPEPPLCASLAKFFFLEKKSGKEKRRKKERGNEERKGRGVVDASWGKCFLALRGMGAPVRHSVYGSASDWLFVYE